MTERFIPSKISPADRVFGTGEHDHPMVNSKTQTQLQRQGERQFVLIRILKALNRARRWYNAYHPD